MMGTLKRCNSVISRSRSSLPLIGLARSRDNVSLYHILLDPAHTILAQACLGVLLRLDDLVGHDDAGEIPLAEYAARHWFYHAQS